MIKSLQNELLRLREEEIQERITHLLDNPATVDMLREFENMPNHRTTEFHSLVHCPMFKQLLNYL